MTMSDVNHSARFSLAVSFVAATVLASLAMLSVPGGAVRAGATTDTVGVAAPDTSHIVATRSGDVQIVDAGSRSAEVAHGGSAVQFALKLPATASCPGDSRNDQWRVQTFIIPDKDDPATLNYTIEGPDGTSQFAVWGVDYTAVINEFTVPNDKAGERSRIDLKPMSFGVFQPRSVPNGTYKIGVACTYFGRTADYWDTRIVIANDPKDKPAQLTWRLQGSTSNPTEAATKSSSDAGLFVVIAIVLAALLVAGAVVLRGRTSRARPTPHLEPRSHR